MAAVRFEINGMVGGRPAIVVEHVTRLRGICVRTGRNRLSRVAPYRVEITGEPSYAVDICPTSRLGTITTRPSPVRRRGSSTPFPPWWRHPGIRTTLTSPGLQVSLYTAG